MDRRPIAYTDHFAAVMDAMNSRGLLLAADDVQGRPNAMTIGWGALGSVWGMQLWIVLVRPSRYTYQCIEAAGRFSVNVPGPDLDAACGVCGTTSGRDGDKFAGAGLTAEANEGQAPTIAECPVVYLCQAVHRNDVLPDQLIRELQQGPYADGDYHRVYYGRILSAAAAEDAAERLAD